MSLEAIRKKIDEIDLDLVRLMNERARLAVEIGRLKREAGQNAAYAPEREREVLERVASASAGWRTTASCRSRTPPAARCATRWNVSWGCRGR